MRLGLFTYLIFVQLSVFSQTPYQFDHLSSEDGLLDDIVYSIYQDSQGYFWIGSMGGLQRYDGHQFLDFEYNPRNSTNGLKENVIRIITESNDGTIWVGTQGGGIARFKDGKLLPPLTVENGLSGNIVDAIEQDLDGNIWVGTENGLDVFREGKIINHFQNDPEDPNSLSHNKVYSIAKDTIGNLWIGTQNGLNQYTRSGTFIRYLHDPEDDNSLNGNNIHDVLVDSKGLIWTAAISKGINSYDPQSNKFVRYDYDPNSKDGLKHSVVLGLTEDLEGAIWVATWGGGLFKLSEEKFLRFQHDPLDEKSISSNNVEEIMIDSYGNLWTANYLGGVNRFSKRRIISYTPKTEDNETFTSTIRDIYCASDGSVWLASYSGAIKSLEGKYTYYLGNDPNNQNQLSSNRVNAITEGPNGEIWLGNYGEGIDLIVDGNIQKFSDKEFQKDLLGNQIHCLSTDSSGGIWLGTIKKGLTLFKNGEFTNFQKGDNGLTSNTIYSIFSHESGAVWIATGDGGLCEFQDGKFTCYQYDQNNPYSVPKNNLRAVAVDHDGNVWVGYYGGLAKMDPKTKKFISYDQRHGLAGIIVEDIAIDRNGVVWIATHSGASRYLPEPDRFETFNKKDGMTDSRLIGVSASKKTDKIYFCSSNSYFEFDTRNRRTNSVAAPTFSDFKLTNRKNDSINVYCRNQITHGGDIILPHNYNSFDISFSSLMGDINPGVFYSYRILPVEEQWTPLINKASVGFKYLKSGEYTFEIQVTDFNGNSKTNSLGILIEHPWWATTYFRAIAIVLTMLVIIIVVRWRIYYLEKAKVKLSQLVNRKTKEIKEKHGEIIEKNESLRNLNLKLENNLIEKQRVIEQLKLTQDQLIESEKMASIGVLTAGIAHELNNPLSYIGGVVDPIKLDLAEIKPSLPKELLDKHKEEFDEIEILLEGMSFGVVKAAEIIRNLLEISPKGNYSKNSTFDINEMISATVKLIDNAENQIEFNTYLEKIYPVSGNKVELNQVLINIIKNACDAIPKDRNGRVDIYSYTKNKNVIIDVIDNGVGIDKDTANQIFEPFFTTKGPGKGTGLGLYISYTVVKKHHGNIQVESVPDKGTKFTITLPIDTSKNSNKSI